MKKCKSCNIEISGKIDRCPLCNSELTGKASSNVFPIINYKEDNLLKKILLFVSLVVGLLFIFTEYYITKKIFISKFIVLGLLTNYITILFILGNYKNILRMMNRYFLIINLLLVLWFIITKSLIITTYFIPILCIIVYCFNSIIMLVYKHSYIIKYTRTILLDSLVGLIPLLFVFLHLTTNNLVTYISLIIDSIFLIGLLIFCKENIIEEFKRTFNF